MGKKTRTFLNNYLTNRKQYTRINGTDSKLTLVKTGVPQGSTIGPLLFLIFVNDLPRVTDQVNYTLFADDTVLTVHNQDTKEATETMQLALSKIDVWCRTNKLSLNTNKTEYVGYGTKKTKQKQTKTTKHHK